MKTENHALSHVEIKKYPLRFTASGSEYLRIWVVNLLLTVVTLGIYYPWAKARRIRYFCNNTALQGHSLDFHGEPRKMFKGSMLAGVFLLVFSKATEMSGLVPLVAVVALVLLAPALFRSSMRFRLANMSWRGIRFHFDGDLKAAYWSVGVVLGLALLPIALSSLFLGQGSAARRATVPDSVGIALGVAYLVLVFGFPYLLWRIKHYQHANYVYGSLKTELRCSARDFYKVTLKVILLGLLGFVLIGVAAAAIAGFSTRGGPGKLSPLLALLPLSYLLYYMVVKSFWKVAMQNLVWSRTGNSQMRFVSQLSLRDYALLQLRNYFFIIFTLGLYWPFAVVASRRMEIEAMEVRTRGISLDSLVAQANSDEVAAVGDAAADLFGFDVGM